MINNIKAQMHRKPTFDKLIYKALLPFNEVKYPDREATILRRSQKATKFDEAQFLGLQRDTEEMMKAQIQQKEMAQLKMTRKPAKTVDDLISRPKTVAPDVTLFVPPKGTIPLSEELRTGYEQLRKEKKEKEQLIAEEAKRLLSKSTKKFMDNFAATKIQRAVRDSQTKPSKLAKEISQEEKKILEIKVKEESPTAQIFSIDQPPPKKPRGRSASRPKESSAPAASSGEAPEEPRKDEVKASTGEQTEEEKLRKPRRTKEQIASDKKIVDLNLPESTKFEKLNLNITRLIGLVGGLNDDQITKYTDEENYNSVKKNKQARQAKMLSENFKIYQELVNKFTKIK